MDEDKNKIIMKYRISDTVYSLDYFKSILSLSDSVEILNNLEIEPFDKFSVEFSSVYWYFQYQILKNKKIEIYKDEIVGEYKSFFTENKLNFIFIEILDSQNYRITCIDGKFYIDIYNDEYLSIVKRYGNKWISLST